MKEKFGPVLMGNICDEKMDYSIMLSLKEYLSIARLIAAFLYIYVLKEMKDYVCSNMFKTNVIFFVFSCL